MSDVVAVQEKTPSAEAVKSRFGYQSAKLRVATTLGLISTGSAGLISSIGDVLMNAPVKPVSDVTFNSLEQLKYTVFEPSLPGIVGDNVSMAAISGAIIGAGVVHALRGWTSFKLPSVTVAAAAGSAALSLIFGGITYGSSVGGDPAAAIEEQWTQQNFSISRELPDPVSDYNNTLRRDDWYPAVFSISKGDDSSVVPDSGTGTTKSDTKEYYYLVEPVLNANGDRIGDNVKQVDQATAQKAQDLYSQHSSSSSNSRTGS